MESKFKPGTLPDHDWCSVHRSHMLGCDQYEYLLKRSGQRCEICLLPGGENPRGKLHIDHFGERWAVRGLLCNSCNTALSGRIALRRPPWAAEYLAASWWEAECERVGVSTQIALEPDCGSIIRDQFSVVWLREGDGKWRPWGHGRPGISSASWRWLYEHRGPHNMAPIDPYSADEIGRGLSWEYLISNTERAALEGILSEVGQRTVPLHLTRARGSLLPAYMEPVR